MVEGKIPNFQFGRKKLDRKNICRKEILEKRIITE
jgi:hypothetical protein